MQTRKPTPKSKKTFEATASLGPTKVKVRNDKQPVSDAFDRILRRIFH
ncbi:hypothetical protein [Alicyclobacillus ferrooxydans]|nr:hypothetical protein [Alicyclobacillus ferrooxydans]